MAERNYLTETTKHGKCWAGPDILAHSWKEAESKAKSLGVRLLGEWMMSITMPDGGDASALADMIIQEENSKRKSETVN